MQNIDAKILDSVIEELSSRAKRARKTRYLIGVSILIISTFVSTFIAFRLTENARLSSFSSRAFESVYSSIGWGNSFNDSGGITRAINEELLSIYPQESPGKVTAGLVGNNDEKPGANKIVGKEGGDITLNVVPITQEEKNIAFDNLDKLVNQYVKIEGFINSKPIEKQDNTFSGLISTLALSAGAVAFILYVLQIAVSFIRYYSQLAELYDSQKTALIASEGNIDVAKTFMGILSNGHVTLGKEPATLYSKALDVISDVAKQKS